VARVVCRQQGRNSQGSPAGSPAGEGQPTFRPQGRPNIDKRAHGVGEEYDSEARDQEIGT
jgi:hypothetical protein